MELAFPGTGRVHSCYYIGSSCANFDIPVVAFDEIEKVFPKHEYKILPVIGYNDMNRIKEKVFN
jgi:hypothetical protein